MVTAREKWNTKYSRRTSLPGEPDRFLVETKGLLKPGTVLDLACGTGHNSIYLARLGYRVKSVDISDVALDRLDRFAGSNGLGITPLAVDLEDADFDYVPYLGTFENIAIFNYKPTASLWNLLPQLLVEEGVLIYCTFNLAHHAQTGFPRKYCLRPGQHTQPLPPLVLHQYREIKGENQQRDGYVFVKRPVGF
ncbi:MAG: methyltransferase domain-containing protein [Myxococcota bacterium]|nr:methyltransferase domain-containing protein [Myxococcota bacterium]